MTPPAAAAPAVRAHTLAPPRPLVPAPRPRRVSGPARPARLRQPPAAGTAERGLALGLLELLQGISRHRSLARLTDRRSASGRAWIAIVVFALLGIVTLQLTLLKLNAGIGRSLERGALLQRENAALSIENSELTAGSKVEAAAEHLGMSLVPAGSLKFLRAHPRSDQAHAAAALSAPVPSTAGVEAASGEAAPASGASSEASTESSSAGEQAASSASGSAEGEAASTASSAQSESSTETAPASRESATSSAPSPGEATSSTAPTGESGPGGGTQAGPTG